MNSHEDVLKIFDQVECGPEWTVGIDMSCMIDGQKGIRITLVDQEDGGTTFTRFFPKCQDMDTDIKHWAQVALHKYGTIH